jgi:hypothetical protein
MSKAIKQHLERITADNLINFQQEAFASYASCSTEKGNFNLGVNGWAKFVVKTKTETFEFDSPDKAIDKYAELVLQ